MLWNLNMKPKIASKYLCKSWIMFYKCFIQLPVMHFNYSNTLTKKLNSERILLKNSGVLKFCSAELWFSILMRYSAIWPLTHGKQEVGDADIGFWWWSDMQTAPSKMLLEIYTTNELTQDSEFFSSSNLLRK